MDVITTFLGFGAIIFVGFIGILIFEKTNIPEVLLLIFIGLLLGPVLKTFFYIDILPPDLLPSLAPYLAALALIIILFEGGLSLSYEKLMDYVGVAVLHTILIFAGNVIALTLVLHYIVGFPWLIGVLLGSAIGGISGAIVIPMVAGTSATEETKTVLMLESVLTDVLCIVSALTAISVLEGGAVELGDIANSLLQPFAVAGLIGLIFGILWLAVLKRVEGKPFAFMITIAALFVLYGMVEYIKASGAIAVLIFGLVLSNKEEFARIFKIKTKFVFEESIRQFHSEISFLVRTFFFVYLGMVFTLQITNLEIPHLAFLPVLITSSPIIFFAFVMLLILALMFLVRAIGTGVSTCVKKKMKGDRGLIIAMIPRGLAAAVLAQLPFTVPAFLDKGSGYYAALAPYKDWFVNIVFMVIVLSVILTTIGVSVWARLHAPAAPVEKTPEERWRERSRLYKKRAAPPVKPEPRMMKPRQEMEEKKKPLPKERVIKKSP
ncbi:MAG: cation:proton antiporter [Candidatus Thermoplasmatota archaeon]